MKLSVVSFLNYNDVRNIKFFTHWRLPRFTCELKIHKFFFSSCFPLPSPPKKTHLFIYKKKSRFLIFFCQIILSFFFFFNCFLRICRNVWQFVTKSFLRILQIRFCLFLANFFFFL